jgi:hypothetical protein
MTGERLVTKLNGALACVRRKYGRYRIPTYLSYPSFRAYLYTFEAWKRIYTSHPISFIGERLDDKLPILLASSLHLQFVSE